MTNPDRGSFYGQGSHFDRGGHYSGDEPESAERLVQPFSNVSLVGSGRVGRMFLQELAKLRDMTLNAVVRKKYQADLKRHVPEGVAVVDEVTDLFKEESVGRALPEAVLLAISNPTEPTLKELAAATNRPITTLLVSNGVDVVPIALEAFAGKDVTHIRSILFSNVSESADHSIRYEKKRIALAVVPKVKGVILEQEKTKLAQARKLFEGAGFEVEVYEDYFSLEWTKLALNCLGGSIYATGMNYKETFADWQLFYREMEGFKDHLELMELAGIDFAHIPWSKVMIFKKLSSLPTHALRPLTRMIGSIMHKSRGGEMPASTQKATAGHLTETFAYHYPFVVLASLFKRRSLFDEAILKFHDMASDPSSGINMKNPSPKELEDRRKLFFQIYAEVAAAPEAYVPLEARGKGLPKWVDQIRGKVA